MTASLAEIARALRGNVCGSQVLAPGPGHSAKDRSLSIRLPDEVAGDVLRYQPGVRLVGEA